ncbi:restriction endonuclease subunit S, partial [Christiangramia flava]
ENLESLMKGLGKKIFSQKLRFHNVDGNRCNDWKKVKLEDVLEIGSGRDYKHLKEGNIPVFGTGGFMTSVEGFLYEGESVGIGRKGTIDKPVFLKGKFWTVDTLFYTHSFKQVFPKFIYYLFLQINWKKYNEATGVPSLSKSTIEKIKIKTPCLAEQTKILKFLSSFDEKIKSEKYLLQQYKKQKQYLLQNMFI